MDIVAGNMDKSKMSGQSSRHLPMKAQLAFMICVVMLLFAVFASLISAWVSSYSFAKSIDEKASKYSGIIRDELAEHANDKSNYGIKHSIKAIAHTPGISHVSVYTKDGSILVAAGDNNPELMENISVVRAGEPAAATIIERQRFYRLLFGADESSALPVDAGEILMVFDNQEVFDVGFSAFIWTFIVATIGSIVLLVIVIIAIERFASPFNRLAEAMALSQSGKRGVRVKPEGALEVYNMAASFNAMMAVLNGREDRLLKQKRELEEQINIRLSAEAALRESGKLLERFKAALDSADESIYLVETNTLRLVEANRTGWESVGYKQEQIRSKVISHIMPRVKDSDISKILVAYEKGKSIKLCIETPVIRKSGEIFIAEVTMRPFVMGDEKFIIAVARDITERKADEEELRRHREHLEEMVEYQTRDIAEARDAALAGERAMSTFLANMSHELRTPLHGVLSYASIALKKLDTLPREKIATFLKEIRASGNNLLVILNDLLDLSKLRAGKMVFNCGDVELSRIVANVTRETNVLSTEKGLSTNVKVQGEEYPVYCDEIRMTQVFRNLYGNAVKFAEPGTVIELTLDFMEPDKVSASIFNKGPCVPDNERETIFDSFVQSTLTATNAGGTGLGLPICREIIEGGHGGKICAEKGHKDGARFIVTLPVHHVSEQEPDMPVYIDGTNA